MKKALLWMFVVAAMLTACDQLTTVKKQLGGDEKASQVSQDTIATKLVGRHVVDSTGTYAINLAFPSGKKTPLTSAIVEFFSEQLGGTFEGDYADSAAMLSYYINKVVNEYHATCEGNSDWQDWQILFQDSTSVIKSADTDDFVTYLLTREVYSGGAHGSFIISGQTFRKADGRRIGWEVFPLSYDEGFQELLKKGLMSYWDVETPEELQDFILDKSNYYYVPLPQCAPLFKTDGVEFIYNQYEIAAYAAGLPSFTVPYEELLPYMNVTGRRLVEKVTNQDRNAEN